MDTWHERISPLDQVLPTGLGRGKEGIANREKMRDFRKRVPTFSLEFPVIGPTIPEKTKGKVAPHSKSYVWVLVLWSFDNSRR